MVQSDQVPYRASAPRLECTVIQGGIGLVPGTGRYTVAAVIAGNPAMTVKGEFPQDKYGSVLVARTAAHHISLICSLSTALTNMLISDANGLDYEDEDDVAAAAFLGVELQQLLELTGKVGLEIDADIYRDVCRTLRGLYDQLIHLREIHKRGHQCTTPYLPEYFEFIEKNPIPDDGGS